MDTITRKSLLYKSGLGFYCINPVQGCSHGCRYPCYAYMIANTHGKIADFATWCSPKLVVNSLELLTKELSRKKEKPDTIHLCLSTDPFMTGFPEVTELSLKLISLINSFNIRCSVLTKGILPKELGDKERFNADNIYGISLISLNEEFRKHWEPGTISYVERIEALKQLHENGCKTLAHIEPYPTPNILKQDLFEILEVIKFVDYIHFSGWNYNNRIKMFQDFKQFYYEQSNLVKHFCSKHGIQYNN